MQILAKIHPVVWAPNSNQQMLFDAVVVVVVVVGFGGGGVFGVGVGVGLVWLPTLEKLFWLLMTLV